LLELWPIEKVILKKTELMFKDITQAIVPKVSHQEKEMAA